MFRNIICIAYLIAFCSLINGQSVEYHAVIAGINDYYPLANNLNWCVKDAEDMEDKLKQYEGWLDANITLRTNTNATLTYLWNDLNNMPYGTGNTNLFFFSGHGSTDGLLTYYYNSQNTFNFSPSSLEERISHNGSFNQYTAILDACFSGVFTEEMTTGVILTACESDEFADESADLQHGIFTYNVLDGLKNNNAAGYDGLLSTEELYWYAFYRTIGYNLNQTPTLGDNYNGNLVLNYNIYVPQQYTSISSALSNAHSGQTVVVTSGSQTVSGNLTVPTGVTLTIKPSVILTFNSGSKLTVNGTLSAVGTSTSPVTFDFTSPNSTTENGIVLNSSSGTINYCQIRNAYRGIYENGVSINITNSAISGCTDGIYLYSSSPTIQGCNIHDNTNAGINMLYSYPTLSGNYIQNNSTGIYCSTSSTPTIGNSSTQVGNYISSNANGIIAFNNACPVIGSTSGGYNNLVNTTYNVLNTTGNTVYAQNNWWGTTDPNSFKITSGNVSYSPYRSAAVSVPSPSLSKTSVSSLASADEEIPMLSELDKAYELAASNNLKEAREICLNLINNYPDYSVSFNALNLLKDLYSDAELSSKKDIYKSLFNQKSKKDLYAMAWLVLSEIDRESRLKYINEVIETYKGESVVEYALFDKFVYYYFELEDKKSARVISDELDTQFPESIGAIEAHRILGDEEYFDIDLIKKQISQNTENTASTDLLLVDNYPNPFNPTTTISYTLPQAGAVQIKIYDILGREVAKLVDEQKSAGKYTVQWNGSNYASGVYFYSVTFNNQRLYKKMLMIK
jgi:parallel beta-helix repeat protein